MPNFTIRGPNRPGGFNFRLHHLNGRYVVYSEDVRGRTSRRSPTPRWRPRGTSSTAGRGRRWGGGAPPRRWRGCWDRTRLVQSPCESATPLLRTLACNTLCGTGNAPMRRSRARECSRATRASTSNRPKAGPNRTGKALGDYFFTWPERTAAFLRSVAFKMRLRRRMFLGVTSTSSSSAMYSSASSSVKVRGGVSCTAISAVEER